MSKMSIAYGWGESVEVIHEIIEGYLWPYVRRWCYWRAAIMSCSDCSRASRHVYDQAESGLPYVCSQSCQYWSASFHMYEKSSRLFSRNVAGHNLTWIVENQYCGRLLPRPPLLHFITSNLHIYCSLCWVRHFWKFTSFPWNQAGMLHFLLTLFTFRLKWMNE